MGFNQYLQYFAVYKIKTLHFDKKEKDFFIFMDEIPKEGLILDIGANIGIMTWHLSKRFPKQKIISFEPMPDNLKVLEKIVSYFKLSNVTIETCALGNKIEQLEMVLPQDGKVKMQGLSHVVHPTIDEWNEGQKFPVDCKTLDSYNFEKVAGIKIDVENFEVFVFEGGVELLKRDRPIIYAELWDNENRKLCFSILSQIGYKAFVVIENNLIEFDALVHQKQNFIFK